MITCPNCNKELIDGTSFCDECGAAIPANTNGVICPNCGSMTSADSAFCESCGAAIAVAPMEEQYAASYEEPAEAKKPLSKLLLGGIAAAAIAVLVLIIVLLSGGSKQQNYAMYVKDGELWFNSAMKEKKSWQFTKNLIDIDAENAIKNSYAADLGDYAQLSQDGKLIFFPDKVSDGDAFTLYYRQVGKDKKDPVKISADVTSYRVNEKASIVTYLKGDDDTLYQYNMKKEENKKIASEIDGYRVSEDGKNVVYLTEEGDLKAVYGKKEEKISSDVVSIKYVSEDLKVVYYIEGEDPILDQDKKPTGDYEKYNLCKRQKGKDKVEIAAEISRYYCIVYESGEVYYVTQEKVKESTWSHITDDVKDDDKYDWTREYLKEEHETTVEALHYYDGKKDTVLTEDLGSVLDYAVDRPVIVYSNSKADGVKVKLSEYYEDSSVLYEALNEANEICIAAEGKTTVLEEKKEATSLKINNAGTIIYYIDDIATSKDEDGNEEMKDTADLYTVTVNKSGKVSKPEVYDSDVYFGGLYSYGGFPFYFVGESDKFVYCKDYKSGDNGEKYELYVDKTKIDSDVYDFEIYEDQKEIVYITDWNAEKREGTLKIFKGKKAKTIADEVHAFTLNPDGKVLYLADYSLSSYKGELFVYNGSKSAEIDEDVAYIIPVIRIKK